MHGDAAGVRAAPDYDGVTQQRRGRWELVVAERSGVELLRLPLAEDDLQLTRLDFDGRWALVSSAAADVERSPLLIDTQGDQPRTC